MVSIVAVDPAECTCIQVAHPSGLFLIGDYLVTHNTALLRAIRGVFQNTPGTSFIREGESSCQVTVNLGDHKVTWFKGTGKKDRPTYIFDGGDPLYPGQAVPDEVQALGVVPIQAGGQEVWPTIAKQFEGQIFLLDKPGSAIAEAVADVERVGQLNRALRNAEGDRRQAATALRVKTSDLVALEGQAARFKGLDEVVGLVSDLEAAQVEVQRLARAVEGLEGLRSRLQKAAEAVNRLAPVAHIHPPDAQEVRGIQTQLNDLRKVKDHLDRTVLEVQRYSGVGAIQTATDEAASQRLLQGLKVLRDYRTRWEGASQKETTLLLELSAAEAGLQEAEQEAHLALQELGQCPTCGLKVAP